MASLARRREPPLVRLTSTHGVMGGKLCVEGTRVLAETVLLNINTGATRFEIYDHFPSLPPGAYEAVIRWAEAEGRECSAS